ncbi:YesL family protein [Virgibacillus ndiopensis]|uniref:YesL family protein n=1 Tax=Virgibacillus ndiopensis TaxID=2004408 RepID=UPI000C06E2F2|nr:YesL family protein [Virgibacillus ndiopensis]
METGFMGSIYKFSDWVTKFLYVNVLWITFSLLGLLLVGFFPATVAMFSVVRKWVLLETDIPVFKTFWTAYKKEFVNSNVLGYILSIIGYILYLDLIISKDATNPFLQITYYLLLIVIVIYLLTVLYIFPIFVHFETKLLQVFKNAFLIMITHPAISVLMGIAASVIYLINYLVPIVIIVFGGSILAYVVMWHSNFAFVKLQKQLENE